MTQKELQKLDIWIAKHVFKWKRIKLKWHDNFQARVPQGIIPLDGNDNYQPIPNYSESKTLSIMVLENCLEEMASDGEDNGTIMMNYHHNKWHICSNGIRRVSSETLKLSICLFAKKLFSK